MVISSRLIVNLENLNSLLRHFSIHFERKTIMCGFVGACGIKCDVDWTARTGFAIKALSHRGPDGSSQLDDNWASLGHARLSIIDLSERANQPMRNATDRFAIVFNGEIYNFRDLYRRYLFDIPEVNANSDTSVLLHLYIKFGKKALQLLNGMFAFAIVDFHAKKVFLARDRFGEKPLYWTHYNGTLVFASELKALKCMLGNSGLAIDAESQALYHMIGSIPAPRSIYTGVYAVEAGKWLTFDGNRMEVGRYWSLPSPRENDMDSHDGASVIEETRSELSNAVSSTMVSDVPVGLFLSGGFDSGAIMSVLSSLGTTQQIALCLDFSEEEFSEFSLASQTARTYGSALRRRLVQPDEFLSSLDPFFDAMDQPTADGFNTYFVCKAAKEQGIKVWLSGVGGDELFGGYPSFRRLQRLSLLSTVLNYAPNSLVDFGANLSEFYPKISRVLHLGYRGNSTVRAYQTLRNVFPWQIAKSLLSKQAWNPAWQFPAMLDACYPLPNPRMDMFQHASMLEAAVYMRSQLLRDMDNFSMAHSLELRAPFLAHTLFEKVFLLQSKFKVAHGRIKPLLADALSIPLPVAITSQSKRGFTFPIEKWLRTHIRKSFEETVLDPSCSQYWDLDHVQSLWKAYLSGKIGWGMIWQLYSFARWRASHEAT